MEPRWIESRRTRPMLSPRRFHHWLRDQGSLTQRVIQACPGRFSVRLLQQSWGRPLESERRLLGMGPGERAMVREVQLMCDQTPWVFARTLIPAGSLKGRARRLSHLGNKPLGAVLFADPTTRRGALQLARLTARHGLFATAAAGLAVIPSELWGRRTVFLYADKPLLVNEIFLPDIACPVP